MEKLIEEANEAIEQLEDMKRRTSSYQTYKISGKDQIIINNSFITWIKEVVKTYKKIDTLEKKVKDLEEELNKKSIEPRIIYRKR